MANGTDFNPKPLVRAAFLFDLNQINMYINNVNGEVAERLKAVVC